MCGGQFMIIILVFVFDFNGIRGLTSWASDQIFALSLSLQFLTTTFSGPFLFGKGFLFFKLLCINKKWWRKKMVAATVV